MRFALLLLTAFFISPVSAAELAPPTIVKDSSSYTVTMHSTTSMESVKQFETYKDNAEAAIGKVTGTENSSMPRPGGGFDVTYRFLNGS